MQISYELIGIVCVLGLLALVWVFIVIRLSDD